jgi:hypothetical protein
MATIPTPDSASPTGERRTAGRLDRVAIGLSSLCLVHCVATVALAATFASAGALLGRPVWHEIGFALAILVGAFALGRGYAAHRDLRPLAIGGVGLALMGAGILLPDAWPEVGCTMAGVALLAVAHRLNIRQHVHGLAGGDARP